MKRLIAFCLLACGTLAAQQTRPEEITPSTPWLERLRADLSGTMSATKLKERAFHTAVADDIMALAEPDHQPSRALVQEFATDLTTALLPRGWPVRRLVRQLTADIERVLQSAGTSTAEFHEAVDDAQKVLIALGVSTPAAENLARHLRAIGEQVRGPEDTPIQPQD